MPMWTQKPRRQFAWIIRVLERSPTACRSCSHVRTMSRFSRRGIVSRIRSMRSHTSASVFVEMLDTTRHVARGGKIIATREARAFIEPRVENSRPSMYLAFGQPNPFIEVEWGEPDLNRRPSDLQSDDLPTDLPPQSGRCGCRRLVDGAASPHRGNPLWAAHKPASPISTLRALSGGLRRARLRPRRRRRGLFRSRRGRRVGR